MVETVGFFRRGPGIVCAGVLFLAGTALSPSVSSGKTVGIVYPESAVFCDEATTAFKNKLAASGFGSEKVEVFIQKPALDPIAWSNALRKFIGVDADLIVVFGDGLLQAVCREKTKIPVLYGFVQEPDLASCVRSESNHGGNAWGVSGGPPLHTLLEKARLMTDFNTVSALNLTDDPTEQEFLKELRNHEKDMGFSMVPIRISKSADAVSALRDVPSLSIFFIPGFPLGGTTLQDLITAATQKGIPTISLSPSRNNAAPMLSLYPNPEEQGRLIGELAIQILRGETPGNAFVAPKKIELEINLPLAKQLGVKVPMALMDSATRIIK